MPVPADDAPPEGAGATPVDVRVLLVDDHLMFASSLAQALDAEDGLRVVGTVTSIAEARDRVVSSAPDVVLLDHRLPDGDGVSALPSLRRLRTTAQFVVLTASTSDRILIAAMEAGAAGFIAKTQSLEDVLAGIRAAAHGELAVGGPVLSRLLPRLRRSRASTSAQLTEREQEVLDLLAQGLSNADIAGELALSVNTVRNHVANLSAKLGAHSKLEALAIAVRDGLVEAP